MGLNSLPMTRRSVTLAAAALVTGSMLPKAPAFAHGDHTDHDGPAFAVVPLVSDVEGRAPLTDPQVANAWGITLGPTTPLWVNNQVSGVSNLYSGGATGLTK